MGSLQQTRKSVSRPGSQQTRKSASSVHCTRPMRVCGRAQAGQRPEEDAFMVQPEKRPVPCWRKSSGNSWPLPPVDGDLSGIEELARAEPISVMTVAGALGIPEGPGTRPAD